MISVFGTETFSRAMDLLGCRYPVVCAGMGGVARSELVAAVTEAGGYGYLGMVGEPGHVIRSEVAKVRERTSREFGVNIVPSAVSRSLLCDQIEMCIDLEVHSVSTFWGVDEHTIAALRANGILVACQVGSFDEASEAVEAGAHLLIVQGFEAGGHVRGTETLFSLLPLIADAFDIPILASGGIVNGKGLVAAGNLGADGVVIGTAFAATQESNAHEYYKERLIEASAGETVHTNVFHHMWPEGAYVRVLPNSVTRGSRGDPWTSKPRMIGKTNGIPVQEFSVMPPLRDTIGEIEAMPLYAGQGVSSISWIPTAQERLLSLMDEAFAIWIQEGDGKDADIREKVETTSPPCASHAAADRYMGYLDRDEVLDLLNMLLEAERAGARATVRMYADAEDAAVRVLMRRIHADEVRYCKTLIHCIEKLNGMPSSRVGDFYDKFIAIEDFEDRLNFLNRGQTWVVRTLEKSIHKIRDDDLHEILNEMRSTHVENVRAADGGASI